jgi:hypothetical protein
MGVFVAVAAAAATAAERSTEAIARYHASASIN